MVTTMRRKYTKDELLSVLETKFSASELVEKLEISLPDLLVENESLLKRLMSSSIMDELEEELRSMTLMETEYDIRKDDMLSNWASY